MTDARCEPPPELRGKDGWHWVSQRHADPVPAWWDPTGFWGFSGWAVKPDQAAKMGHCHVGPCLTPAEVTALRAERDAAVAERNRLQISFDLRRKADMRAISMWQGAHPGAERIWPDHADMVTWLLARDDTRAAELTALRAEVERLRKALERISRKQVTRVEAWTDEALAEAACRLLHDARQEARAALEPSRSRGEPR